MSSAGHSIASPSNFYLIVDALGDYAKKTGIDLSKNPFAEKLQLLSSPDDILGLLQEREKAFNEYRDQNQRLISCLGPAVQVLHVFSGILGEAVSLVPFPPAKAVFVGIDVLLEAASGVSSSYDSLLDLFECFGSFLKRLEIYTDLPPTPAMTDIIVKILVELLAVLALATKQIKQGRFKKFTKKLLGESDVEAVLQRLDQLTQDEARMTVAQTLGVVHGLVNNLRVVMEDGKASMDGIRQTLSILHQMVIDINKIKREQLQRDVQHWLSPPDPSTNHDFVWEAHQEGTAAWFFESNVLAEWKSTGSILWIHGKPGSGKSTLLSAIVQDIEGMRAAGLVTMAYYYFDFRDVKKQNRYGLLTSLVSQLSAKSDSCYEVLSQLYSDNAGGTGKPTSSALTKCLKDMLRRGRIYIIIDALDECPDSSGTPSAREHVLELIEDIVDMGLPNVHLCVSSRPEIDIRAVLDPLTSLQISLHNESGQKKDIIKYIKSVVHSDRRMRKWKDEDKQLIIDILCDKADGMFRWVVCQIDRLRRSFPASIRGILNELPKSLDETYGRTLLCIDEEKREYAQRLFRCLTVSIRPLRVEELAEIFAFRFDLAAPTFNPDWRPVDASEAVLSACSSLIAIVNVAGSQVVQFSHFSVKEFLTSKRLADAEERLSYYHILPEPAHTTLACASLSVLLQLDYKIDRTTIRRFPLAHYAARYWIDHAQFRDVSRHIQDDMARLFDPEKPYFGAWVWLYDIDRHWLDSMSEVRPTRPKAVPLYYASLCGLRVLVEHLLVSRPTDVNALGSSHATPLHAASTTGQLEVAKLLLKNGADPNLTDDYRWTPLHTASRFGHLNVVEVLLDQGVDMDAKAKEEWTPLHIASFNDRFEVAQLLIERGAGVDIRNNKQKCPLDLAAICGSVEIARLLLKSGANVHATDGNGWTPLHSAAHEGYRECAQLLLESGANLDARNNIQETPLIVACCDGELEVSRFLIDKGSDVNSRDIDGCTPLHSASRHGHLDVARLLIGRGAEANVQKTNLWTPLHLASANGHLDIAELLVKHGAIVDSRNDTGETPLDRASGNGHLEIVRLLIEHGADIFSRDVKGWTPFHSASKSGHLHVVRFLLECGVDIDIRSEDEETSLDLASSNGELDIVRFLIEKGADIHTRDKNGWNPLHTASQNGHLDVVRFLMGTGASVDIRNGVNWTPLMMSSGEGEVEVSRFLIERGADMNARDKDGWAPLHFASRYGHVDVARLLIDSGVDPDVRKDDLWSPLHLSSACGHLKVTWLLVERGARIHIFNDKKETPLDRAAGNGQLEIVCLLIDHSANLHSVDSNGWTPLHKASKGGHLEVVKLLLRRGADVDVLDKANKTAAGLAFENDNADVPIFLAEYKAEANGRNKVRLATMATGQRRTDGNEKLEERASLHTASKEGNLDLVKSLLEDGVDVNARKAHYLTPLHLAATKGNVAVARLLIERGAEVDPCGKNGWTPLHFASGNEYTEVSQVLVDHGANVNARLIDYETPLHLSARNGNLRMVELLLERGAEINALNDHGQTPYQLSLSKGRTKVADLLWKHGGRGA